MIGKAATALEKASNALNYSDPLATLILTCAVGALSVATSLTFAIVGVRVPMFLVGAAVLLKPVLKPPPEDKDKDAVDEGSPEETVQGEVEVEGDAGDGDDEGENAGEEAKANELAEGQDGGAGEGPVDGQAAGLLTRVDLKTGLKNIFRWGLKTNPRPA